jgi:Trypsin
MLQKWVAAIGVFGFFSMIVEPALAGRISGDYSNPGDIGKYINFTGSLARQDSTGYLLMSGGGKGTSCTGVLIAPSWAISSAHCARNPSSSFQATSGKFASAGSVANITSTFIHKSYVNSSQTYFNNFPNASGFYQNFPQRAAYDIALFKLDRNLIQDGGMIPIKPSTITPTGSFVGNFAGYGRQGDGRDQNNFVNGLSSLTGSPTTSELQAAAIADLLGGSNVVSSVSGVLYSDFDDGTSLRNIDRDAVPQLAYEFSPDTGDSGSGLFDANGNLVGLVSGGGYGNKVVSGLPRSFEPFEYGSLAFYTPLSKHAGWLSNVISLNNGLPLPGNPILPKGNKIKFISFSGGNLSGELELDDALFSQEFNLIEDTFSEDFDEQVYNSVFVSNSQPPTPVPTPALLPGLIGFFIGAWRKRQAKIAENQQHSGFPNTLQDVTNL